jgi:hypothetical protein
VATVGRPPGLGALAGAEEEEGGDCAEVPAGELQGASQLEATLGSRHPHRNFAAATVVLPTVPLSLTPPPPPLPLRPGPVTRRIGQTAQAARAGQPLPLFSPPANSTAAVPQPALALTYTLAGAPHAHHPAAVLAAVPAAAQPSTSWSGSQSRSAPGSVYGDSAGSN